jgi:F-type H+-transporting ATPase subunit gamma
MQMVAASKMRKAQNATLASRNYSELAWDLINNLSEKISKSHPLFRGHGDAKKIGVVLITSNRGLVGGFNINLLSALKQTELDNSELIAELTVIGRKGRDAAIRTKRTIVAEFPKHDSTLRMNDIYPLAQLITDQYTSGDYKKIYVIYNHFVSTLSQKPVVKQLLPFSENSIDQSTEDDGDEEQPTESIYQFEPDPQTVINELLPRIIESQLYQAVLESDASEHSARMVMMKNATEAAGDLIDDLTLTFNQIRQSKITTELSEITAGKSALEK